jgi:hypothetical protein
LPPTDEAFSEHNGLLRFTPLGEMMLLPLVAPRAKGDARREGEAAAEYLFEGDEAVSCFPCGAYEAERDAAMPARSSEVTPHPSSFLFETLRIEGTAFGAVNNDDIWLTGHPPSLPPNDSVQLRTWLALAAAPPSMAATPPLTAATAPATAAVDAPSLVEESSEIGAKGARRRITATRVSGWMRRLSLAQDAGVSPRLLATLQRGRHAGLDTSSLTCIWLIKSVRLRSKSVKIYSDSPTD